MRRRRLLILSNHLDLCVVPRILARGQGVLMLKSCQDTEFTQFLPFAQVVTHSLALLANDSGNLLANCGNSLSLLAVWLAAKQSPKNCALVTFSSK